MHQPQFQNPWCFVGDYNVVLGAHEFRGRGLPTQIPCQDFRDWTNNNSLTHVFTRGVLFTWSNGRKGRHLTEKRLDRAICNDSWLDYWSCVPCVSLTKSRSDHFPLLLDFKKEVQTFPSSLKFMRVWYNHPD